jgi:hypothetical protein
MAVNAEEMDQRAALWELEGRLWNELCQNLSQATTVIS